MFKKFALIRSKVTLHKRSIFLCGINMLIGLFAIPFITCWAFWVINAGMLHERFYTLQYLLYSVLIGVYWYICGLRIWSHSYMLDYTKRILANKGHYCPRCFSPMKSSKEDFTYEEKIGENRRTTFYWGGDVITETNPIMAKRKESIPYFKCKNKSCALRSKAQKSSAMATQIKAQIKENYSFREMPRTLSATYRLIAGDRQNTYKSAMMDHFCSGGFCGIVCLAILILLAISKLKNLNATENVYHLLWGTDYSKLLYIVMSVALVVIFVIFQITVKMKTSPICSNESFQAKNSHFDALSYDIYNNTKNG